jgi:hypothetical protein
MENFTKDPYWTERGCPLNAFFAKKPKEEPEPEPEPKREVIAASDFQKRKAALVERIIKASNGRNVEKLEREVYAQLLKDINSKECTLKTIEVAEAAF